MFSVVYSFIILCFFVWSRLTVDVNCAQDYRYSFKDLGGKSEFVGGFFYAPEVWLKR